MKADPDQEYRIEYKVGWSCQSGSASFGAKALNGVDLSVVNSVAGSYLKSQVAQISHMI